MNVLPDIELGPVGQWKYANALALCLAGVVQVPELRTLVLRVPALRCRAKREDPFLGAGFFLVPARAAEGGIELVFRECLLQPFSLPQIGVQRAVVERV